MHRSRQTQPQEKIQVKHSCSQSKQHQCKTLKLKLKNGKVPKEPSGTHTKRDRQKDRGKQTDYKWTSTCTKNRKPKIGPHTHIRAGHSLSHLSGFHHALFSSVPIQVPSQGKTTYVHFLCTVAITLLMGLEPRRPRHAGCVKEIRLAYLIFLLECLSLHPRTDLSWRALRPGKWQTGSVPCQVFSAELHIPEPSHQKLKLTKPERASPSELLLDHVGTASI